MANLNEVVKNFDSKTVEKLASQISDSLESSISRPSRVRWFLMGAALSALGIYLLDPKEGARRRQMIVDKTRDLASGAQRFGQEQWENIQTTASSASEATRH